MEIAIAILAFGCVFLLVFGLKVILDAGAGGRRLAQLRSAKPTQTATERESLVHSSEKGLAGILHRIGERREGGDLAGLRARLLHAGYRKPAAPAIYYGFRLSLALGLPPLVALVPAMWSQPAHVQIGLLCLIAAIGYLLPTLFLNNRVASRQGAITRMLPDALDLMVVCVEAGFGINQSLSQVADEFRSRSPIVADEFSLVVQQIRAGKSTTEALRELADRTGVSDISSLVALLVQTERFGTSVANALRVHAEAMRILRMQRAEERAQKATLKLILPSSMIFAALLLVFLAPGMYELMNAFGTR